MRISTALRDGMGVLGGKVPRGRVLGVPVLGVPVLGVLVLGAIAAGCGESTMTPIGTCGMAGRTGQTDCSGVTTCNAGQYCDDSGFPTCVPGCTSDQNCGANEVCARPVGEAIGACQACPVCGNGVCEAGENATSCAGDCTVAAICGNGVCEAGETAACADCASGPICGNGVCEPGETAACADCVSGPMCGNGVCEPGESTASCAGDCPDMTLAVCLEHCNAYNFFECFAPGGLAMCRDMCEAATTDDREQFDVCASTGAVSCDEACFELL